MVKETNMDEAILQIFEEQESQFFWPVATQKEARAFVKALNGKGIKYDMISAEINEFSTNFMAWRTGLGRIGIGNRVMERINQPLQEILESDDEDEEVLLKVKQYKAKCTNGDNKTPTSSNTELDKRLHSEGGVTPEQKKDITDSWMKNMEDKTSALKQDANGNNEDSSDEAESGSSESGSRSESRSESSSGSSSGSTSSSSSVEREIATHEKSSERAILRHTEKRSSKIEEEVVFMRSDSGTQKSGESVMEQVNMKPSDILKRQSPRRQSPVMERASVKREQSPLVSEKKTQNIPTVGNKVDKVEKIEVKKLEAEVEKLKKQQEMEETKKEGETKVVESVKEREVVAPTADSESLSSSSSSNSSEDEKEEEKNKEEEESTSDSSTEKEESEDEKTDSEDEKSDKEEKEGENDEIKVAIEKVAAADDDDTDDEDEDEDAESSDDEKDDEFITESYDSDLDKDNEDESTEFQTIHKYRSKIKSDADGPGYLYVFTDSARDATHHRMKISASRYPNKRLEQAQKFNLDLKLQTAVPVTERKAALRDTHNALEKYRMDHQVDWFYGLPQKILSSLMKVAEKYVSETSDC